MNEMEVCAPLKPRPSCPPLHNVAFASHLPFHETATLPALPPLGPFFLHLLLSLSAPLSFSSFVSFSFSFSYPPALLAPAAPLALMAVQAWNPSSNLADLRNRPSELLVNDFAHVDPCNVSAPYTFDSLSNFHQVLPTHYHQQTLQSVAGPATTLNCMMFPSQWPATHASVQAAGLKKRRKDSSKPSSDKRLRQQQVHQMTSCGAALPTILKAEGDQSTILISRPGLGASLFSTKLADGLSAQISKQQGDIIQLIKIQTEQLRLAIEERARLHSKALLANVEEWLSCKLRDRNAEFERVNKKNLELEEKVNCLSLETRAWQSKAWSYDAMASVLRANLQQDLTQQSRQQGVVEGCGDSDDDAASAIVAKDTQETRLGLAMTCNVSAQRACKKCKAKEMSVLLLPCLHLSLCSDCKAGAERCPTCNFHISECVEVYLS